MSDYGAERRRWAGAKLAVLEGLTHHLTTMTEDTRHEAMPESDRIQRAMDTIDAVLHDHGDDFSFHQRLNLAQTLDALNELVSKL